MPSGGKIAQPGPGPFAFPDNVSLPPGGITLLANEFNGKYTIQAQYPEETDSTALVERFTEELAKKGWKLVAGPEVGVNDGISADYETDSVRMNVTAYVNEGFAGLTTMLQSAPKKK